MAAELIKKSVAIASVTNATPNVMTINDSSLNLQTGMIVSINGLVYPANQNAGNRKSNVSFRIKRLSANSFELPGSVRTEPVGGVEQVAARQ